MANKSTDRTGIMTWVSAIRTTMANDPGRQLLEDQIQSSGFLFLEDYLDSILAGPKHDPIFELVKTPGRKKDASKKTRAATAAANKAKTIMTMDLEDEDFDKENEVPAANSTPINAFHKALLQSKDTDSTKSEEQSNKDVRSSASSTRSSKPPSSKRKPNNKAKVVVISDPAPEHALTDEGEEEEEEKVVEKLVTPPHLRTLPPQDHEMGPPEPVASATWVDQPPEPPQPEPVTELSVIAEDEEPAERSQSSMTNPSPEMSAVANQSSGGLSNKSTKSSKPYHKKSLPKIDMMTVMDIDDFTQTTNFTVTSTSAQSFETVPLDSPAAGAAKPQIDECVTSRPQSPKPRTSVPHEEDYTTAPLPTDEARSELTQQDQPVDTSVAQKPTGSEFPTIGPPSPLRKSMRVPREPSLAMANTLPSAKPAATRSSWLVRAREAKAMEDNTKKLAATPAFSHHLATGNKRKSGEMLGTEQEGPLEHDDASRTQKLTKITATSPVLSMLKEQDKHPFGRFRDEAATIMDEEVHEHILSADGSDGMINKLKKTVAGFSARAGKSMGKSLGGAAATALAEAKAAAEAKIAERNAAEGRLVPAPAVSAPQEPDESKAPTLAPVLAPPPESKQAEQTCDSSEKNRRLSVSDLVTKYDKKKSKEHERVFQPPPPEQLKTTTATTSDSNVAANTSTSTTPPNSPPKARPPIFTLPEKPKLPPIPTFFPPPSSQAFTRLEPQPFAPPRAPQPHSAHSTLFSTQSTYSDAIFDNEIPPWVPSTQDTDLSDHAPSQNGLIKSSNRDVTEPETDMDADESWHLDEKFGETWTPVVVGMKDDSMTWSTAPTRSTRSGDTGALDVSVPPSRMKSSAAQELPDANDAFFEAIPSDNPPYTTTTDETDEEDMDVEYDENIASVRLVTPAAQSDIGRFSTQSSKLQHQGESQTSSNNAGGFFSSASKLMSSVLGGSKKGKEPVKSLQLAAAAAKKQQEEADKKANRLKEMEARRQQVLQKKVDEDKAREERKAKDENERWKREREKEDTTEKRALRQPGKKLTQLEDDLTKKRKVAEMEKKTETKKPPSKDKKDAPASKIGKFVPASSQSGPSTSAMPSKTVKQATATVTQSSTVKLTNAPSDGKLPLAAKGKGKPKETDVAVEPPSQVTQSQMQARYQAQLDDSRKGEMPPPPAPAESMELPDINSEYSNSDDEDRIRSFDPPNWAQSPELREALQTQSTVNPDDIFGAIRPLKMEELFKNRTSRFRARTSSANWAGADELTAHEEREYERRMGYRR